MSAAPVVFDVLEQVQRAQASDWLSLTESDVALWEARGKTQRRLCSEIARCADLHCRRRRCCRKQQWIASQEKAARARLADARARLPTPQSQPASPGAQKKGRTEVRP